MASVFLFGSLLARCWRYLTSSSQLGGRKSLLPECLLVPREVASCEAGCAPGAPGGPADRLPGGAPYLCSCRVPVILRYYRQSYLFIKILIYFLKPFI